MSPAKKCLLLSSLAVQSMFLTTEVIAKPHGARPHTVRVVYIIPKDEQPWNEAKRRASEWLEDLQWFLADEMQRRGYEPKTFKIARDRSGSLLFHQIGSPLTRVEFAKDAVNNCKRAADAHDLRPVDDVVIYFYEFYSITDGKVGGAGARGGTRGTGGEAFLSSLLLKVARREWMANNETYEGKVFDWIGQEPMKPDTLSWNGRGKTLGDVSGSSYGVMGHELGHAFGLSHDMTADANRKGNLMGNGCRGMRGYFTPKLTSDFCVLSERNAGVLNKNEYFKVRKLKPKSSAFSSRTAGVQEMGKSVAPKANAILKD